MIKIMILSILAVVLLAIIKFSVRTIKAPILIYSVRHGGKPVIWNRKTFGKISVEKALKLAAAYLDKGYELRLKRRNWKTDLFPTTYVVYKDHWYYIFKDNYPWKAPVLEVPGTKDLYSVKIHADTGELIQFEYLAT